MVQAAQHVSRHPGPLGHFFRKLAKRKNRNVAVVAMARKMVVIAWHMLKHNESYRYSQPASTEMKLQKLRVAATGESRKRGTPKGQPRSKNYGTGKNTTIRRSIDQVLEREDLPPSQPLAPGEQRMLRERGIEAFVDEIHTERRVSAKRSAKAKK